MHYRTTHIAITAALFSLFVFFLASPRAAAYDANTTHPGLTREIARIYNLKYDPDLSPEDIAALIDGATREDISPRWINHFYDPSTGEGWNGSKMGAIGSKTAQFLSRIFVGSEDPLSSLDWTRNRLIQQRYSRYEGDRTLGRAFDEYLAGNKTEAYRTLGHILHLVEDASVPAHVRQDTHLGAFGDGKDLYEEWTAKNKGAASSVVGAENTEIQCDDIDTCFRSLAKYTQENFLSLDTFDTYPFPLVDLMQKIETGEDDALYALIAKPLDGQGRTDRMLGFVNMGPVETKVKFSDAVQAEYWSHLSKMAVATGARIVKVFHDETQREKERREYPAHLVRYDLSGMTSPMISPIGELQKARDLTSSLLGSAGGFFNRIFGEGEKPAFTVDLNKKANDEAKADKGTKKESGKKQSEKTELEGITATRVIDGDTIVLSSGAIVRYIGIDAPETALQGKKAECFSEEAKKRNETLVLHKPVRLERGPEEADAYGRLLRYVWVGDTLVNQRLVEEGAARAFDFGHPHFYTATFAEKSLKAKSAKLGIFGPVCSEQKKTKEVEKQAEEGDREETLQPTAAPEKLLVSEVRAHGDEFVEIYNPSLRAVSLDGYYLAYYSPSRNQWNDPWRNKAFPENAVLDPKGYYLIAFGDGSPSAQWKPYQSSQLGNGAGTVAVWYGDPANSVSRRIDAVGWGNVLLSEGAPVYAAEEGESVIRFPEDADTDFNASDFRKTVRITPGSKNAFAAGAASGAGGANALTSAASGGGGSQQNNPPDQKEETSSPTEYPKLLISEIQTASTISVHDEFVELYNPNDTEVALDGWYVQKKTKSGSSFSTFAPASLFAGRSIAPHSYLVIAHPSSTIPHDVASDNGIANNNTIAVKNPQREITDKVGYGEAGDCEGECAVQPEPGTSILRKVAEGAPQDTDQNGADFEIQTCPSPGAPSAPCEALSSSSSTVTEFSARYNPDRVSVTLSWTPATSTETSASPSATSTDLSYEIRALDATGEWNNGIIIAAGVHGTSTEQRIVEIGIKYAFAIKAVKDGVAESEFAASNEIEAPSFFSNLLFYRNPIAAESPAVLEAYYDRFPFVPKALGVEGKYQAVEFMLHTADASSSPVQAVLKTTYRTMCGAGFPFPPKERVFIFDARGELTPCPGGTANTALAQTDALEDMHFLVTSDPVQTIRDDDYITVSFYDVGGYESGDGREPVMTEVARDVSPHYLTAPTADELIAMHQKPSQASISVAAVENRVTEPFAQIAFSTSTDADSLDKDIKYFLRITASSTATSTATSTLLGTLYPFGQVGIGGAPQSISGGESIGVPSTSLPPVFYPSRSGSFQFSVNACDEFDACSEESVNYASLSVPEKIVDIQPGSRIEKFAGQGAATSSLYYRFGAAQGFSVNTSIELKAIRVFLETPAPAGASISIMRDKTSSSTAIYTEAVPSSSILSSLQAIDVFPPGGTILDPGKYYVVMEAMPPDESASIWYLISRFGTEPYEEGGAASFLSEDGTWQDDSRQIAIAVFGFPQEVQ